MSEADAKAGTGPAAPKPQQAAGAGGSGEATKAPQDVTSRNTEAKDAPAKDTDAKDAAPKDAAPKPAKEAGTAGAKAGGAAERPARAAAGARAAGARAARAGAAAARSTAAVSTRPGAAAAAAGGNDVSRRSFLSWISAGWLAFGALTGATLIGTVRFLFPNVLFEPPQTFRAGFPEEYTIGDVSTRFKDQFGVWIVRTPTEIYVLSTVCTHLGCTPAWLSGEQKFKCPCHGSGFRKTGINFEGPAPRPLERYRVTLSDDGQILVDKTRKYQWEKGEWNDPESFLAV